MTNGGAIIILIKKIIQISGSDNRDRDGNGLAPMRDGFGATGNWGRSEAEPWTARAEGIAIIIDVEQSPTSSD